MLRSLPAACVVLSAMAGLSFAEPAANNRPNVVLIYADDLGPGDLSCYGATRVRTPHTDRLANEGKRFTSAYAPAATCTPSRFALMTGEYAWRKPGRNILDGSAPLIVPTDVMTLPKVFKAAGYSTGLVGKWHLGLGTGAPDWNGEVKPGPIEVGFDQSFIISATGDRTPCVYVRDRRVENLDPADPILIGDKARGLEPTGRDRPDLVTMKTDGQHQGSIINGISRIGVMAGGTRARWSDEDMADTLTREAVGYIEKSAKDGKPFFLMFSTHDVHAPRVPHPRFVGKTEMGPRGDSIVQFDFQVGAVLDALDKAGLADKTIVMLSSDNGPVLIDSYEDRADELAGDHAPAGIYRGTKYSILEGGTRVPLLVRWPGTVPAGQVSDAIVHQIDFAMTFADLLDVKLADHEFPDAMSARETLLGMNSEHRPYSIQESWGAQAIRAGEWKYVAPSKGGAKVGTRGLPSGFLNEPQLFNLASDPAEQTNLASQRPDLLAGFQALDTHVRTTERTRLNPGTTAFLGK
jgi:arylsulfatase A-like enzyme